MPLSSESNITLTPRLNTCANTDVRYELIDSDPEGHWRFLTDSVVRLGKGAESALREYPGDPAAVLLAGP